MIGAIAANDWITIVRLAYRRPRPKHASGNDLKRVSYRRASAVIALVFSPVLLSACSTLGSSGPSAKSIRNSDSGAAGIQLINLTDEVARQVTQKQRRQTFAETFGSAAHAEQVVGAGDILDIAIWEAPPAALFGTSGIGSRLASADGATSGPSVARSANIPEQMVDSSGKISVPFMGQISVVGRTPAAIAREITTRLAGKAHDPQVIVRIAENQAANVTVVGEVSSSRRVPLTTKGERLLDALASAGGVKQPVNKVTIQVTRDDIVATEPLAQVIAMPAENILLRPNDVVTALYQPYSFQALGAFGTNAEVNFEATGLTLAQAMGRIGGLQDNRADIKGVFVFRLEDPAVLGNLVTPATRLTPDGKVPVIYRIDMADPSTFFVMQGFQVRNNDILYVSNAPLIDIQKFVTVISSMAFSIVSIGNAAN